MKKLILALLIVILTAILLYTDCITDHSPLQPVSKDTTQVG
jgi:hypothetical protein